MTIREVLAEGRKRLETRSPSASIETPALDASLLLAEALGTTRTKLLIRADESLHEAAREKFAGFLERRRKGECIAYILGRKEFRGLDFSVNPKVLVPRPDTETLVEAALEYLSLPALRRGVKSASLLDLCTGSGALAVSIANEHGNLLLSASDISEEALLTAEMNAARLLGGNAEIAFIKSDLFENIPGRFDIIVSNPPYIPTKELAALSPEVRGEPALALNGGEDGLDLIKRIISASPDHLLPGGFLALEADPREMPQIERLLECRGFAEVKFRKDLAGKDRVISAVYRGTTRGGKN